MVHKFIEWDGMIFLIQRGSWTYMSEINCDQIEGSNFCMIGTLKKKMSKIRKAKNQWLWKNKEEEGLGKDD